VVAISFVCELATKGLSISKDENLLGSDVLGAGGKRGGYPSTLSEHSGSIVTLSWRVPIPVLSNCIWMSELDGAVWMVRYENDRIQAFSEKMTRINSRSKSTQPLTVALLKRRLWASKDFKKLLVIIPT